VRVGRRFARSRSRAAGVLLACLPGVAPAAAAQVRVGVDPAVVTVGEPFNLVVEAAPGSPMALTVTPDSGGRFEARGAGGSDPAAGLAWAPMVAWRTGAAERLRGTLRIGDRAVPVELTTPVVRSVLPADTAGVRPKPPRDVIGPDRRPIWGAIVAGAALALALLLLIVRRRRRPRTRGSAPPPRDVRTRALRELERIRSSGLLERGEVRRFYEETGEALRAFAADWSGGGSRDLTTGELVERLRDAAAPGVSSLAEVLGVADEAKFAGRLPAADALREWEVARGWVAEQGIVPAEAA